MSVDVNDGDRQVYERELQGFLPAKIFDAHVHVFDHTCMVADRQCAPRSVAAKFGGCFTMEQCRGWAAALLPEQEFYLNSFGMPSYDYDRDASAAYSGAIADNRHSFAMALVAPRDDREAVIRRVEANRLIGYKPYLDFVEGKPKAEITIFDMLPAAQMEVADERGLAIMLHIPRRQRLADRVNQAQMVEICRRYPRTRIIFAHIGRAYYLQNVMGMLDGIAGCANAYVDTAMVNHEGVLEYTFRNFPRERIVFGSDAPVACLHGKSVEVNNQYAYLMAEDYEIGTSIHDERHAVSFTTFYYEQLRGIKLAAERAGLSRGEIEGILFNNAMGLFRAVAEHNYGSRRDCV